LNQNLLRLPFGYLTCNVNSDVSSNIIHLASSFSLIRISGFDATISLFKIFIPSTVKSSSGLRLSGFKYRIQAGKLD